MQANYLEKIINSYDVNFSLLKNAYLEYKNSSLSIRSEYSQQRKKFVEKYSSSFFDEGTLLSSSGTSTGFKKKYKWGPNWEKFYYFYEWLKFEHLEPYDLYFIQLNHPLTVGEKIRIREGKRNYKVLEININSIKNAAKSIIEKTKNENKIILWFNPSSLKYFIDQNFNFDALDPNKFIIYSTGEVLNQKERLHLQKKGFSIINAMRCWDGGATFITCQHGNTHWIDFLSIIESDSENNLISSDLYNLSQNFLNYKSNDKIDTYKLHDCKCGLPVDHIRFIKTDDYCFEKLGILWDYEGLNSWMIASIQTALEKIKNDDFFAISFGYHQQTKDVVVFLGTKAPLEISQEELKKIQIAFRVSSMINMNNLIICNWPRFGKYKQERIFFIEDSEYEMILKNKNSFSKI